MRPAVRAPLEEPPSPAKPTCGRLVRHLRQDRRSRNPGLARSSFGANRAPLGIPLVALADMMISTMNELPSYEIEEVFGEAFGLTVRSRNLGSQLGAVLKSLIGGELKGMTKMLAKDRQHATDRLVPEAKAKGANAIIAFRFDTSELGSTWTEICAYGTAVRARKV
jgi:uncharacterized protein YbjQ (UPF0145 family)